jgi:hypothetical protein
LTLTTGYTNLFVSKAWQSQTEGKI